MKLLDIIRAKTKSVTGRRKDEMNNAGNVLRLLSGRKRQSIPKVKLIGEDRILKVGAIPGRTMLQQSGEGYSMTGSRNVETFQVSILPDDNDSFSPVVVTDNGGNEHYFYEKATPAPIGDGVSPSLKLYHLKRYADGKFADVAYEIAERWRGAGGIQHSMYPSAAHGTDNDGIDVIHLVYIAHCADRGSLEQGQDQENTKVMYRRYCNGEWTPQIRLSEDWKDDWGTGNERFAMGDMGKCDTRPPVYHCMNVSVAASPSSGLVAVVWSQHPRYQPCGEYHNIFVRIHERYGEEAYPWHHGFWKATGNKNIGEIDEEYPASDFFRVTPLERAYLLNMSGVTHWYPRIQIDLRDHIHLVFSHKRVFGGASGTAEDPNFIVKTHYLECIKRDSSWYWNFTYPDQQPPTDYHPPQSWVSASRIAPHDILFESTTAMTVIFEQSSSIPFCFFVNAGDQYWYYSYRLNGAWTEPFRLIHAGGRYINPGPVASWIRKATNPDYKYIVLFASYVDRLTTFFLSRLQLPPLPPDVFPPSIQNQNTLFTIYHEYRSSAYNCSYNSTNQTLITAHGRNSDIYHQIWAGIVTNPESHNHPSEVVKKVKLELPHEEYVKGLDFYLSLYLENNTDETITANLVVLLEWNGNYYYWPDWDQHVDFQAVEVPPGRRLDIIIERFWWPGMAVSGNARFYAAMLNDDLTEIIGGNETGLDTVGFSWK